MLNRNACLATITFMNDLIEIYPRSKCILTWVEGSRNSADLVSKFFKNPIMQANSNFYRNSAYHMCSEEQVSENMFTPHSLSLRQIRI